ncbi:hypothetical protein H8356DRAFT_1301156 [Neocallimastix lanati (nom. inval.)]|uniref:peptidylprolyl isomerase n=1 Tax=Neocallimastix californiae TaxID=1754190 RepID=A0A1Y2C9D0_9FUNG|nr:hypothetical protein H8356DRAFT_1301156 [Neocallimastix sp. JGI-2020a]ORY43546.1 hypothetical protein LY90DRAFT_703715 [Neocallimastix californiae]|eukprot:ORY43546.1 hypothetical protein LY90DRAFT_703715 [Neocallimastix californiae]
MFWGLKIMPGKTYSQTVEYPFKVTMACLGQEPILGRHCLFVRIEDQDYMLCSLNFGQNEQQSLNLVFSPGEEIVFHSTGKGPIYLSGMYDIDDEDMDDDEESDAMDEDEDEEDYVDEGEEDDDEEEDDDDDDEIDEEEVKKLKADAKKSINKKAEKKAAPVKEEKKSEKKVEKKEEKKTPAKEEKKAEKKTEKKTEKKAEKKAEKKKAEADAETEKTPKKRTLSSGLVIEDITIGTGAKAKSGKRVGVRYIGKLAKNGKVFDQNTKGAVFKFNLGKGEVIKGWDLGVNGMNIGGVRRLTIPSHLAYGVRGAPPDIPPNSTLIFEVKMITVGK